MYSASTKQFMYTRYQNDYHNYNNYDADAYYPMKGSSSNSNTNEDIAMTLLKSRIKRKEEMLKKEEPKKCCCNIM